ncbi:hypothetical protein T01_402 [Trichinella spiralis]|uniref:Uncharacterized protein n=1 Tax=Trichinella spiralis TaxID=6334 RepID=A0A0V1BBJ8_TRISP|nr:hypothetical protein T01_402 [Trichinella spiralis]
MKQQLKNVIEPNKLAVKIEHIEIYRKFWNKHCSKHLSMVSNLDYILDIQRSLGTVRPKLIWKLTFFLKLALSVARILHSLHRHGSVHVLNYDSTL